VASARINAENAKWWTLGVMCLSMFMVMLDGTVVNVALPSIQRDLDASISTLEWTVNGYTLALAALLITGGRLGDVLGRRRLFITGAALFSVASATAGIAQDMNMLVVSRFVEGSGAALMLPATLSIIANAFPAEERGRAIGTWAGVSGLALSIGPLVGGLLTEHVSWRAIFYINVPIGLIAVVAALRFVRESTDPGAERSIDYGGVAAVGFGLMALVLALVQANTWGWGSSRIVTLLVVAVLLLIVFAVLERRIRAPMLELPLFRDRNFLGANAVAFVISFAMTGVFFFFSLYMQEILDYSPLAAGLRFLPATLAIAAISPIAGKLADRIGCRIPMVVGMVVTAGSMYALSGVGVDTSYSALALPFLALGVGIALTMSPMSTAAMDAVPEEKAGVASGVLSSFRFVGGTFGVAVLGAIFQGGVTSKLDQQLGGFPASVRSEVSSEVIGQSTSPPSNLDPAQIRELTAAAHEAFVNGLASSFRIAAAVALAGGILALLLIRTRRAGHAQPVPAVAGT
jgi:EmrB/QacA subfamily drug resistance transporter